MMCGGTARHSLVSPDPVGDVLDVISDDLDPDVFPYVCWSGESGIKANVSDRLSSQ
jgi:hypothetical protein